MTLFVLLLTILAGCTPSGEKKAETKPNQTKEVKEASPVKKEEAPVKVKEQSTTIALEPIEKESFDWIPIYRTLTEKVENGDFEKGNLYSYFTTVEPYDIELEIKDTLISYFQNERTVGDSDAFHQKFSDAFIKEMDESILKLEEEKLSALPSMDQGQLQSYIDYHKLYIDAQRTHLKRLQIPAVLGVFSQYRESAGLDRFNPKSYERFEMDSTGSLQSIRPFDQETSEMIARLIERSDDIYSEKDVLSSSSEVQRFELVNMKRMKEYLDEVEKLQTKQDSNTSLDSSEEQNYWNNFVQMDFDRYFYYGMKKELKDLEKDVLPTLESDEQQVLRDYIDMHLLFIESIHLYSEEENPYEFENMFVGYVTSFLAETEENTSGPYPELKHLQQSEVHPTSAE